VPARPARGIVAERRDEHERHAGRHDVARHAAQGRELECDDADARCKTRGGQ
jgi:hypothetical protein